jgi:predicted Zn-ribbon and HTH transcriptional regulator
LEVADIFRGHGPAWRQANAGHVSLDQLKVMSAIESCRTAALGGHVARCQDCAYTTIAYNSCRNRHCPKCQGAAAKQWLAERAAELLPVSYFHVVFTLPAPIADIAYQNKAVIYDLLFKVSAETMLTIAADPKHLGAKIGITTVLHTWGSALTHHPHVHMIVPGGGIARDGKRWVSCRPGFFLPVRVLHACSAGCSWRGSPQHTNSFSSSAIRLRSPMLRPSPPIWRRCARPNGSSIQSPRSADPGRCWPISPAIPTALPSPIAA